LNRAAPLLFLPLFIDINLDVLYLTFVVFFYSYGIYLHSGYEADWLIPSDHWMVNTSFQHYVHHAKATRSRAYHCGFFIKAWDQLFGTTYPTTECFAKSQREAGKRTVEIYEKDVLAKFPNYELLLSWRFWFDTTVVHPFKMGVFEAYLGFNVDKVEKVEKKFCEDLGYELYLDMSSESGTASADGKKDRDSSASETTPSTVASSTTTKKNDIIHRPAAKAAKISGA